MSLDIYKGSNFDVKTMPIATIELSSDVIEKLREYSLIINEYGKTILQLENTPVLEKVKNILLDDKNLLDDMNAIVRLIQVIQNEGVITLIGD